MTVARNRIVIRFLSRLLFTSALAPCAISLAYAGSSDVGELVTIERTTNRFVLVFSNGERSLVPSCAHREPSWWAIDASTIAGQEQLKELAILQKADKKVRIVGTGECVSGSGAEMISFFYPVLDKPTRSKTK